MVAEDHPDRVVPYTGALSRLLDHKTTRVRWEAAHAIALTAALIPELIEELLPILAGIIRTDASVIARDHAVDAVGNYAATSAAAAEKAYPLLKEVLSLWEGKQAGHALKGMANVAGLLPAFRGELKNIAEEYSRSGRGVVRKAAKDLLKAVENL